LTVVATVAAALVAAACTGGSGAGTSGAGPGPGSASGSTILAHLAIGDAKDLFIGASGQRGQALRSSSSAPTVMQPADPKLYKITSNDQVLEVSQTCLQENADGGTAEVPCATPLAAQAIYDAGPDYVMITFGSEVVLARKSDGAVFPVPSEFGSPAFVSEFLTYTLGAKPVQSDAAGNIYFEGVGQHTAVVKIDTSDPANLTVTRVTPESDIPLSFIVFPAGDIMYWTIDTQRIRLASGAYTYPPANFVNRSWLGLDGRIYFLDFDHYIYGLGIDASGVTASKHGLVEGDFALQFRAVVGDRLLLVVTMGPGGPTWVIEASNPDAPNVLKPPCLASVDTSISPHSFGASANAIWILTGAPNTGRSLLRWNGADQSCSTVVPSTLYDVTSFAVGDDDVADFHALRLSDSRKVLAKVDGNGVIATLEEGAAAEVISLERIR
jgi:hypothetical protein